MDELPLVHIEIPKLVLEAETVPPLSPEDQLAALHVVIDNILELWHQSIFVH